MPRYFASADSWQPPAFMRLLFTAFAARVMPAPDMPPACAFMMFTMPASLNLLPQKQLRRMHAERDDMRALMLRAR